MVSNHMDVRWKESLGDWSPQQTDNRQVTSCRRL